LYRANIPYFLLHDGQIAPDPRNHPPAASAVDAQLRHQKFGDLMNHVRLLQMLRKATQDGLPAEIARLEGKKRSVHDQNFIDMWLNPPSTEAKQNAWTVAEGILVNMAKDAQKHRAEFWISAVGPPIEENPSSQERNTFLQKYGVSEFSYTEQRLQSFATGHGIRFAAVEPALSEYAVKNNISLRGFFNTAPNYGHWNESGNAAAAAFLGDNLLHESPELNADMRSAGPMAQTHDTGKALVSPTF
jgi:hypothetical protein